MSNIHEIQNRTYHVTDIHMEEYATGACDCHVKADIILNDQIEIRDIFLYDYMGSPNFNFSKVWSNVLKKENIKDALDNCDQPVFSILINRFWKAQLDAPRRPMDIPHQKRIDVFKDTLEMIHESKVLESLVENSIKSTKFYPAGSLYAKTRQNQSKNTDIRVTNHRTFEAAVELSKEFPGQRIAVLNFASAVQPGGHVLRGSSAQEEGLCRCSTLYPVLCTKTNWNRYYNFHRKLGTAFYSDACLYSKDIVILKTDDKEPVRLPEEKWTKVDVISCAAPRLYDRRYPLDLNDQELYDAHISRGAQIFKIAQDNNIDVLVLGAFGCGAFHNNPEVVASAYAKLLGDFMGSFDCIEFAVYCKPTETENYDTFRRIIIKSA